MAAARSILPPRSVYIGKRAEMGPQMTAVVFVLLLAATIITVDVLFFRNAFWARLTVNIGIVLIFTAFYFRFLKHP